jgi:hypothetical protein
MLDLLMQHPFPQMPTVTWFVVCAWAWVVLVGAVAVTLVRRRQRQKPAAEASPKRRYVIYDHRSKPNSKVRLTE